MTAILVVEDHPMFREALVEAVRAAVPANVHQAATLHSALQIVDREASLDLIIVDLRLPDSDHLHSVSALRGRCPDLPILVISAIAERNTVRRILRLGAAGFIPKSSTAEEIVRAVRTVIDGARYLPFGYEELAAQAMAQDSDNPSRSGLELLTGQERRVLRLLKDGHLNKQIAHELAVTERTVKSHVSAILRKLQVATRTQAAIAARELEDRGQFD